MPVSGGIMKIFYFTATGNSLHVAKKIGGKLLSIPQMIKEGRSEFEDESIGFVYPCYGFAMPRLVEKFILKSKFKAGYFFAVMTYGNIAANGLQYMEKVAAKAGIRFNYTNEIIMVDNYLPIFDMDKQLEGEENKNIEPNIYLITSDIKTRKNYLTRKNPLINIAAKPVTMFTKRMVDNIDENFIINNNCTRCAACAKVCPKNNIVMNNKPQYLHKCDYCMACIQLCRFNAIHLKKEKNPAARFKNYNIEISEIIAANNQQ
jgi:ferredoxin